MFGGQRCMWRSKPIGADRSRSEDARPRRRSRHACLAAGHQPGGAQLGSAQGGVMIRRPLLWVAGNPRLERMVTQNRITSRAAHRFVAGERLEEALQAAAQLNSHGIGGILDLLGEGVTDVAGAAKAV